MDILLAMLLMKPYPSSSAYLFVLNTVVMDILILGLTCNAGVTEPKTPVADFLIRRPRAVQIRKHGISSASDRTTTENLGMAELNRRVNLYDSSSRTDHATVQRVRQRGWIHPQVPYEPSNQCIVTDLPNGPPHGYPPGVHRANAGAGAQPDRSTLRETRTSPSGRGMVCISAAIPAYSDFNRPSADTLQRNGYDPHVMRNKETKSDQWAECARGADYSDLDCRMHLEHRTFSGHCNNHRHPHRGNASQPYNRITERTYFDGTDGPRIYSSMPDPQGRQTLPLPNPRRLSVALSQGIPIVHPTVNVMLTFFGQFLAHDLALRTVDTSELLVNSPMAPAFQVNNRQPDCCLVNSECNVPECFQFGISPIDPLYARYNVSCHQFARSIPSKDVRCRLGVREQFSTVSHWLDLSTVYGSSDHQSIAVRLFHNGQLRFRDVDTGLENDPGTSLFKQIMPSLPVDGPSSCRALDVHRTCFLAGDDRVNQQPSLAAIHTIFLRYHNAVAYYLGTTFLDWSEEMVFQEARKFVTAAYQVVIYKEFLPALMGDSSHFTDTGGSPAPHPLELLQAGYFTDYDPNVDAHVLNEFTTAAFRLHTLLGDSIPRLLFVTGATDDVHNSLSSQLNNQTLMYEEGNADSIINGMLEESALAFDGQHTQEIQGRLFSGGLPFGLDLLAIDIQRGRDHGIGTYNDLREACGFGRANDFEDLEDLMPTRHVALLHDVYRTVDDIDLMMGGLLERPTSDDASLGPTFACVVAMEFYNKRVGDRFWHENVGQFTLDQLEQLRQVTMAEIICQTTALRHVPSNAFLAISEANALLPCKLVPEVNLPLFFRQDDENHIDHTPPEIYTRKDHFTDQPVHASAERTQPHNTPQPGDHLDPLITEEQEGSRRLIMSKIVRKTAVS